MYSHKEIDFDNKFVCLGKRFPVLQLVVSSAYSHPMELKLRIPTPWPYPGLGRGKSSDYRSLLSQNFLGFVAPIVSLTVRQGYPRVKNLPMCSSLLAISRNSAQFHATEFHLEIRVKILKYLIFSIIISGWLSSILNPVASVYPTRISWEISLLLYLRLNQSGELNCV